MADHISYGEFGVRFVHEAVTDERVADAIAAIAGDSVEVGPLSAGPGGLARARAKGRIGWPRIRADRESTGTASAERWARDHIVAHIPGSGHAPE